MEPEVAGPLFANSFVFTFNDVFSEELARSSHSWLLALPNAVVNLMVQFIDTLAELASTSLLFIASLFGEVSPSLYAVNQVLMRGRGPLAKHTIDRDSLRRIDQAVNKRSAATAASKSASESAPTSAPESAAGGSLLTNGTNGDSAISHLGKGLEPATSAGATTEQIASLAGSTQSTAPIAASVSNAEGESISQKPAATSAAEPSQADLTLPVRADKKLKAKGAATFRPSASPGPTLMVRPFNDNRKASPDVRAKQSTKTDSVRSASKAPSQSRSRSPEVERPASAPTRLRETPQARSLRLRNSAVDSGRKLKPNLDLSKS